MIGPAGAGKYVDVFVRVRFADVKDTKDGIIGSYVCHQGEAHYTLAHNITNAALNKRTDLPADLVGVAP